MPVYQKKDIGRHMPNQFLTQLPLKTAVDISNARVTVFRKMASRLRDDHILYPGDGVKYYVIDFRKAEKGYLHVHYYRKSQQGDEVSNQMLFSESMCWGLLEEVSGTMKHRVGLSITEKIRLDPSCRVLSVRIKLPKNLTGSYAPIFKCQDKFKGTLTNTHLMTCRR